MKNVLAWFLVRGGKFLEVKKIYRGIKCITIGTEKIVVFAFLVCTAQLAPALQI
jgi:hypothetical protein